MRSYFIWYGTELLDAVRLPTGASDREVIAKSIDNRIRVPMYPDTCNGSMGKLISGNVTIKTYEGE